MNAGSVVSGGGASHAGSHAGGGTTHGSPVCVSSDSEAPPKNPEDEDTGYESESDIEFFDIKVKVEHVDLAEVAEGAEAVEAVEGAEVHPYELCSSESEGNLVSSLGSPRFGQVRFWPMQTRIINLSAPSFALSKNK